MKSQNVRTAVLCVFSFLLLGLVVGTVWYGNQTVNQVRALKDKLAESKSFTQILIQRHRALKADLSHNQSSVRLAKLQKNSLPNLKRPESFLEIQDIPFLSATVNPMDENNG